MDKQNYIINETIRQEIKQEITRIKKKVIHALEKEKVIKRERVLKDYSTLVQAAYLYIVDKLSFQRLSDVMAVKYHTRMSDNAWKKQLRKAAPIFMETVLLHLQERKAGHSKEKAAERFKDVCAIDATDIAMEGRGNVVMRVHTQLSLRDRSSIQMLITDNHTSENVKHLPIHKDTLYFADRAYGKAAQLACMYENGAEFIFRISPNHITIYEDKACTRRIDYKVLLAGSGFDRQGYFRHRKHVYPVRIVGRKLPEEKQMAAEKKARKKASKNRTNIRSSTIELAKWIIVASSLGSGFDADSILDAYRKRWQIELFFKRSKTLIGLKKFVFLLNPTEKLSFSSGLRLS